MDIFFISLMRKAYLKQREMILYITIGGKGFCI